MATYLSGSSSNINVIVNDSNVTIGDQLAANELPRIAYNGPAAVDIEPLPGKPSVVRLVLQDDRQRSFSGVLPVSIPNDLDVGSEAPNTIYYIYVIPDPTNDNLLVGKVSTNPPATGPVGSTNFGFLGAVHNDASSNLVQFRHTAKDRFFIDDRVEVEDFTHPVTPDSSPVAVDLSSFVPVTAEEAWFVARLRVQGSSNSGIVYFYVDGSQSLGHHDFIQVEPGVTNMQRKIIIPLPGAVKQFYREINESSGDLDLYQLHLIGWIDGYLA
jgi:hypothetical protein